MFRTVSLTACCVLSLFFSVTYTSCFKDPCIGVYCHNNGRCVGGGCKCQYNYYGQWCDSFHYVPPDTTCDSMINKHTAGSMVFDADTNSPHHASNIGVYWLNQYTIIPNQYCHGQVTHSDIEVHLQNRVTPFLDLSFTITFYDTKGIRWSYSGRAENIPYWDSAHIYHISTDTFSLYNGTFDITTSDIHYH